MYVCLPRLSSFPLAANRSPVGSEEVLSSMDHDVVRRFNESCLGYQWQVCGTYVCMVREASTNMTVVGYSCRFLMLFVNSIFVQAYF